MTRLALLAVGVLAACSAGGRQPPPATQVPVEVAAVRQDTITEQIEVLGRLAPVPGASAVLAAPSAGVVAQVHAQVGQRVRRGDPLLTLDVPELDSRAEALAAAAAAAEREAGRQHDLLSQGITSQRQADEAAAAALAARAEAETSRRLLARTRLTAPIRGAVQRVAVQQGERVEVGAVLLEIIAADTVDLLASVPAAALDRIHPGQRARVTAEGDSSGAWARVQAIAPGVDPATGSGWILLRAPNPGGRLRPGAGATATIQLGTRQGALIVPESALVVVGDSLTVFVVGADSTVTPHAVSVGTRAGGRAEVRGTLSPGDLVVTQGAFGLAAGMRVVPTARP
jgi:membrane fusion protein (multidrug efflux system)